MLNTASLSCETNWLCIDFISDLPGHVEMYVSVANASFDPPETA